MSNKKFYKRISYSVIDEDILVLHLSESHLDEEELLIFGLAQFIELVEYKKPSYIIIDKKEKHVRNHDSLQEYLKHHGIDPLFDAGVIKIFFIVSESRFSELKSNIGYRGIEAFTDMTACLEEIGRLKNKN